MGGHRDPKIAPPRDGVPARRSRGGCRPSATYLKALVATLNAAGTGKVIAAAAPAGPVSAEMNAGRHLTRSETERLTQSTVFTTFKGHVDKKDVAKAVEAMDDSEFGKMLRRATMCYDPKKEVKCDKTDFATPMFVQALRDFAHAQDEIIERSIIRTYPNRDHFPADFFRER
eukprot:COSAG01_NODE_14587_length_1435_cov_2.548653_1_plen_172_part_00